LINTMQRLEKEVFSRTKVSFRKLQKYGFKEEDGIFVYRRSFNDDDFEAVISIDQNGEVEGKVIDKDLNEEYVNIHNRALNSSYVEQIKEAYLVILEDIKKNCFEEAEFIYPQSQRINDYINKTCKLKAQHPLKKHHYALYAYGNIRKPLALIRNGKDDEYEAIEIRSDEEVIRQLKDQKGFEQASQLDKNSYIGIRLDDSLDDEIIYSLLDRANELSEKSSSWLVPANPKYYDVFAAFKRNDVIDWKQSAAIKEGDYVYLYVGAPYSSIMYKCIVVKTDIPYEFKDSNLSISRLMKIEKIRQYQKGELSFAYLNSLGINAIRSQRRISKEVSDKLK